MTQYLTGVVAGDPTAMAACVVPPMDEWLLAMAEQVAAMQEFVDAALGPSGSNEDAATIAQARAKVNPFLGISRFEFSDIRVDGDEAKAAVKMVVLGEERSSTQRLARRNGRWLMRQMESAGYSDADAQELRDTSVVTKAYAVRVRALAAGIRAGNTSGEAAEAQFMKLTQDVQAQINSIRAKHPKARR